MSNDPILDAIRAGGTGVAEEDPILSAITGTSPAPSANLKKRAASAKVSVASTDESDPILNAINGQASDQRTPTLEELATGTSPETRVTPLSTRAARMGRSMIPLGPPSVNVQSDYWPQEFAARQRDIEKVQAAQQQRANEEQERQAEIAKQPFDARLVQSMITPGTALGTLMRQSIPEEAAPQFESDYFKHRAAEAAAQGKSVWDAFPHSITEALIRSMPVNRNMSVEQARRIAAPLTQPLVDLPTATGHTGEPLVAGAERTIGGFTSPENIALLGSLGSLETAAQSSAGLLRHAPRIISGLFATQMGTGLIQSARDYQAAKEAGDTKAAQRILGSALVQGPLTLLAAYHASLGRAGAPVRAKELLDSVHAADNAAAHISETGGTVGAGERLAPETLATLQAQTDALEKSTNRAVFFPRGQQNIPEPPDNATVTVVRGSRPGSGTWYHSDAITPQQVRAAVKDGSYAQLLGYTQSKEQAVAAGKPTTVVARDASGTELKAGLVDSSNPQAVAEQAAEFARQFPESKIGIETPEQVISSRTAKPETSTPETGLSPQTRALQEESDPILRAIQGEQAPSVQTFPNASAESPASLEAITRSVDTHDLAQKVASIEVRHGRGEQIPAEEIQGLHALMDKIEANHGESVRESTANQSSLAKGETIPAETAAQPEPAEATTRAESSEHPTLPETAHTPEAPETLRLKAEKTRQLSPESSTEHSESEWRDIAKAYREQARSMMPFKEFLKADARLSQMERGAESDAHYWHNQVRTASSEPGISKRLESATPAVGNHVQVTSGKLKGKTAEVTRVTDEGGVYVRTDENSRVQYVKAGDFEAQAKPPFETGARDDLLAPNEGEALGTRYSGLSPAALKKLLPESVREKLDTEVGANRRARGLQGKLYDLESQNAADVIRARNVLREAPGTAEDMEAIYHHLEDPGLKLSSEQRKILDGYLRPILDESERINEKLEGGQVENYVHRIPAGKGNLLDRILGGESKLSAGRGLSKSSGSLKGRTMMALEDEAGNRRVVSIKDGRVTAFDEGRAENLGRIRGLETQGIKSRGEVLDRELEPMQRELDQLETERRTLTATKGREISARRRIENIDNREAELREALQDAYRTDQGHLLSEGELRGRVFVDKNGKQWKIGQATTKEIEANTGVRYYKNALASTVLNYLNLRRAERAYDFLESYKQSPEFQEVAAKMSGRSVPAGWRPTELPQFHGYAFEPHTAEVLDWYAKRMHAEGPNLYRQIGNFLRTAIFFNPLIHTPNIGVHWIVEKGLTGFGPQNWGRILRTGSRAIDAVIHQNSDFLDALDAGAPLQSARLDSGATTKLLLERMGRELEANPTAAQRVAKALGYANPVKLIRSIYDFSGKVTWVSNDVAMLQAVYEHMERTGSGFKEAMTDVSKHIPDYRLPTRIFNSTAVAKLMSNPDLTMFGAYHYGALRSYGEMAKGLLSEDVPPAERMKSLDRMAMLGLFTFVAYPALDQLAKYLTGDKSAQFRRAGASTFIYNLAQLAQGEKSPTQVLEAVATPAVHTKALLQLAVNRDFFTGRHIVDWNADAETIAKQLTRYAGQNLAPVSQGMQVAEGRRTFGQQVAGLAGIKTKVPTPAEALARKFAAESTGTAAPDQDTLERSYLRKQFENDLRDRKITLKDLGRALTAGTITVQDAKTIVQRAVRTPLQNEFKSLPIEKALQVWGKADAQERQLLRPLLIAKAERVNPARYSPAQLRDLRDKFLAALTGRASTTLPTRPFSTIPLLPPSRATGSIPLRPPAGAGARQ